VKNNTKKAVGCTIITIIIGSIIFGCVAWANSGYFDEQLIDEGIITSKNIENSGGWGSGVLYLIELNNVSEYAICRNDYYIFNVNDHVGIYRVWVLGWGIQIRMVE
jgi:hypothetical protein